MSDEAPDRTKPLCYVFREGGGPEGEEARTALTRLGIDSQLYGDPRDFLLNLKRANPAVCLLDFSTSKTDIVTAVFRTIRSILGETLPVLALVPKGRPDLVTALGTGRMISWIELPLADAELAAKLSSFIATDAIALQMRGKEAAIQAGPIAPPAPAKKPPLIDWLFEKAIPPLIELGQYVEFHDDAERQLRFYGDRLKPFEDQVIELVKKLRRREEKADLLQSLRAFGVAQTRNLVTTMALANATMPKSFGFDPKTGSPSHEAKVVIPYAMRLLDRIGEGNRFYETGFSAGLVFDLFARLASDLGDRKRPLLKLIDAGFADGMRRVEKGLKLGKQVDDLALARHMISTIMMREAGKIAMAMQIENYPEVRKFFEKKGVPHSFQVIAEEENFNVGHNLVGALICQAAPGLGDAFQAVLFCDVPVPLHTPGAHHIQALAAFCRTL